MRDFIFDHPFFFLAYLAVISLVAIIVCIYDKWAAKHATRHRTPEATLLLLSALGGSVAMLATMFLIRHKTKHAKFMIGIPIIILLQVALAAWILLG
ncbi:MAG: DUF1294 domain-containing protein [Clostridia bacterium]|nr:DUF1294 domain-containing protein [Clostridia bacterium]